MVFEFWNLNFLVKRGHRGNGARITENGTLICREDLLRRIGFFSFLLTSREQLEVTISLILHYLYFVHLTTLLFSKSSFLFGPEAIRSWFPLCLVLNNVIRSETINFVVFQLDSLTAMNANICYCLVSFLYVAFRIRFEWIRQVVLIPDGCQITWILMFPSSMVILLRISDLASKCRFGEMAPA